ncbi:hypothetical protein E2C01_033569 [Portunus trituberculatus]|uniref:Uncharacterized protein n=1 Tax=Portunus trituberculatus TaxID=210409 RepID=A0A5B7F5U3_PORTR|nr:hypothetical protein [Portunus trituberculatus]
MCDGGSIWQVSREPPETRRREGQHGWDLLAGVFLLDMLTRAGSHLTPNTARVSGDSLEGVSKPGSAEQTRIWEEGGRDTPTDYRPTPALLPPRPPRTPPTRHYSATRYEISTLDDNCTFGRAQVWRRLKRGWGREGSVMGKLAGGMGMVGRYGVRVREAASYI